jgi:hypothetical protein
VNDRGEGSERVAGRLALRALARRAAAALGGVVLVLQVVVWWPRHARRDDHWLDVRYYFEAAAHTHRGEPLYSECASYRIDRPPTCYLYPPTLAAALSPFGGSSRVTFQTVWYGVVLLAFWVYVVGLLRLARIALTVQNILAGGLVVQLAPGMIVTMSFGNVDVVVWALCALSLAWERMAALLGVAAVVKLFPAWPLVLSCGDRLGRRFALAGAVGAAAALVATALAVGGAPFVEWVRSGSGALTEGTIFHGNFSVPMAALRILAGGGAVDLSRGAMPAAARVFLAAAPLVGVPLLWRRLRPAPPSVRRGVTLIAALLLSPICWWYYAPLTLVPLAALRGAAQPLSPPRQGRGRGLAAT